MLSEWEKRAHARVANETIQSNPVLCCSSPHEHIGGESAALDRAASTSERASGNCLPQLTSHWLTSVSQNIFSFSLFFFRARRASNSNNASNAIECVCVRFVVCVTGDIWFMATRSFVRSSSPPIKFALVRRLLLLKTGCCTHTVSVMHHGLSRQPVRVEFANTHTQTHRVVVLAMCAYKSPAYRHAKREMIDNRKVIV